MKQDTQGGILLVVGLVTGHLALSGAFQSYVRTGLRIPLLLAGAFLAVVGLASAFYRAPTDQDAHGHGGAAARVGVLMLVFVITVYLVAPAPLGAYAAGRGDQNRAIAAAENIAPPDLAEPVDGHVEMGLIEFLGRTFHYPETLDGVPVRLIGFAAPDPDGSAGYRLTRFTFACCAADATPLQVLVVDPPGIPPDDQWVVVEGMFTGEIVGDELGPIPVLTVTGQELTTEPSVPYEY